MEKIKIFTFKGFNPGCSNPHRSLATPLGNLNNFWLNNDLRTTRGDPCMRNNRLVTGISRWNLEDIFWKGSLCEFGIEFGYKIGGKLVTRKYMECVRQGTTNIIWNACDKEIYGTSFFHICMTIPIGIQMLENPVHPVPHRRWSLRWPASTWETRYHIVQKITNAPFWKNMLLIRFMND